MKLSAVNLRGAKKQPDPYLLEQNIAQDAMNCRFDSGSASPWLLPLDVTTVAKIGTIKSIFNHSGTWYSWLDDVNVVNGPVPDDIYNRVYFTGDGVPKVTDLDIATAGGTLFPNSSYHLGIPAPRLPLVTVSGTATDPDPTLIESRSYCITYVSQYGEEGPPSNPTEIVEIAPGQTATISNFPGMPSSYYGVPLESVNIYRTSTGTNTTTYQYVMSIPAYQTSAAVDTTEQALLGEVLASLEWVAPPTNLVGLISLPNGSLAGFFGKTLCFSVPYRPHAWPISYRITVNDTIISIGAFGNSMVATTTGYPYVVTGQDPSAMSRERMEQGYSCVSKRGTVDMGYVVVYPSEAGLMVVGMGETKLATDGIFSREQWNALSPDTIHAYHYAGYYVAFFGDTGGGFVFKPDTGDYCPVSVNASAGHYEPNSGDLFLFTGGKIKKWNGSTVPCTASWRSKKFPLYGRKNFTVVRILAETYPLNFIVSADGGASAYHKTVIDSKPHRIMANGFTSVEMSIEAFKGKVTSIEIAGDYIELSPQQG